MQRPGLDMLATPLRRRLLFASLYFAEGAPIGFAWWTLPGVLRRAGVEAAPIGDLLGLLALIWGLKFLVAPLADSVARSRAALTRWIVVAQAAMGATLVPLFFLDPARDFGWLKLAIALHAVTAASQDVGVDALAVRHAPAHEFGRLNGWMQGGMLLGRALVGGGALAIVQRFGLEAVVAPLIAAIAAPALLLLLDAGRSGAQEDRDAAAHSNGGAGGFGRAARELPRRLLELFRDRRLGLVLAVALTAGLGFEGLAAFATPWLIDRGLSDESIGAYLATVSIVAMIGGALFGGRLADRIGPPRATGLGVVAVALAVGAVCLADAAVPAGGWRFAVLTTVYVSLGALTAASYSLFMATASGSPDQPVATRLSVLMAGTNLCEAAAATVAGHLAQEAGYRTAFLALALASLAALPLLRAAQGGAVAPADGDPER